MAIVRSDREAPARTTGGAASRGGVGSPWPWAVLAWAALLVEIVVSFRPAVPVIWGDTPSFVESALRTLEAGRPTVAGGRDPGYPAFLAVTFAFGGDLGAVVRLQQVAWAVLMLALAATAQAATRSAGGLVPIILVATYPGLLLFTNVLTAELLFAVFLNLAMAGLLVATCVGKTARSLPPSCARRSAASHRTVLFDEGARARIRSRLAHRAGDRQAVGWSLLYSEQARLRNNRRYVAPGGGRSRSDRRRGLTAERRSIWLTRRARAVLPNEWRYALCVDGDWRRFAPASCLRHAPGLVPTS